MDADELYSELDGHQRRRLYFLLIALGNADPNTAVETAQRMERFVVLAKSELSGADGLTRDPGGAKDGAGSPDESDHAAHGGEAAVSSRRPVAAGDDPAGSGTVQRRDAPAGASEAGARDAAVSKIRLDPAQRAEFERAIKAGAANHELAARFGLTPRQAHGFRIGFARRKATPGPATLGNKASPHVEATERLQQEIFLRQRPPQPPVMDDVVRFLRQQDDIVVRNGDGFLVNARLLLSAQELVARANAKRIALGKPPFSIDMRPNGGNLSLVVRPRDDKLPDASRA